ncbi:hypothetical protein L3Y34_004888 [Caenorhabditis briggsae]|uniref:Uncharacterized protein n=1 Tax=Caenorhabditis briggsae TaxID=6238 RepID=A0AAE9AD81_CAEBR|nr:hypothetical protein L3Y34_004888 [Caenorhabditis briggsae]
MISNWNHVDVHLALHQSQFYYPILLFALLIPIFLFNCAQRGTVNSNAQVDKSKSSTTGTTSGNPVETTAIAQDSLMAKPEQESPTGGTKSNMLDSIKIIRGKKNLRKPTQKQKKGETDSQHTQIINIPLGKASGSEAGANKLTIPEEQKAVEKPNGKKIQFADKIVKSTITPGAKKCF